jgi:hypothetical protein
LCPRSPVADETDDIAELLAAPVTGTAAAAALQPAVPPPPKETWRRGSKKRTVRDNENDGDEQTPPRMDVDAVRKITRKPVPIEERGLAGLGCAGVGMGTGWSVAFCATGPVARSGTSRI